MRFGTFGPSPVTDRTCPIADSSTTMVPTVDRRRGRVSRASEDDR
jgi:hypothetical protein